jgi:endoglucanase
VKLLLFLIIFLRASSAAAQIALKEIRTASDTTLVVLFESRNVTGPVWNRVNQTNEVNTADLSAWKLNGQPVFAIDQFVTPSEFCDYHIYLHVGKLVNGAAYALETPHGNTNFVFDDRTILCESIKANQNAYCAASKVRYANFAIWLGAGGPARIEGTLPTFTVLNQSSGREVARGTVEPFAAAGQDRSSGDYVYRIDLAAVPEGGPYIVSVKGYGRSYPFGVGSEFSRRLGHTAFRTLYYQRCGCPIVKPYAEHDLRPNPCHTNVFDTQQHAIAQDHVRVGPDDPRMTVYGGYHDAGDSDRLMYHMLVPTVLLTTFEAFPEKFSDGQFNIPDKFDKDYHIVGKGNGTPDILDEAVWGTLFWEYMQTTNGGVRWGDSTMGFPDWVPFDRDHKPYGTMRVDDSATSYAAGLFMNLARVIKPFDSAHSRELEKRGDMARAAVGSRIKPAHEIYYAIQKYLLTGDEGSHARVKELAPRATAMADTYCMEAGGFTAEGNYWLANYFVSYLLQTNRPTDPTVVRTLKAALRTTADKEIAWLNSNAYPFGWAPDTDFRKQYNYGQGYSTVQGQLAFPCLMQWALTKEQKYLDAVSQLMDYVQGLNPLGKCYASGIGSDSVRHPHDRESVYAQAQGWGPRPGLIVYGGPYTSGVVRQLPPLDSMPRERHYIDHLGSFAMNEFTVYQTLVFPAAIYPVLAP